jgi:hypothetical protein
MKFIRTVKITRVRREVLVSSPPAGHARCPNCGCALPPAAAVATARTPAPSEEKK